MNVSTLKDFEKELQTKIRDQLAIERESDENLARILLVSESQLWNKIRAGGYSWLKIDSDRKQRLYKLIRVLRSC